MHCPYCNEEHPDTATFCPRTGQKIHAARTCGNCGVALEDSWKVCTACGTRVDQPEKIEYREEEAASPSSKPGKSPRVFLIGLFTVLLIILLGYLLVSKLQTMDDDSVSASTLEAAQAVSQTERPAGAVSTIHLPATETPTPATPRSTSTPRGTITPTKAPDYKLTPWAEYECADKTQIVLRANASGRVVKDKVELLEKPAAADSKDHKVLRLLQAREHILVLDGPICLDNATWWQVKTESSTIGWTRELDAAGRRLLKR